MMNLKQLWRGAARLVADSDLSGDRLTALLSSRRHTPYMARHRAAVIGGRLQVIAWAFAVLTLGWVGIDLWLLPLEVAIPLAGMRAASTAMFAYLGWPRSGTEGARSALLRLTLLMLNPLAFYLAAEVLFTNLELHGLAAIFISIYNLLPFIVVAGLSVFPLTVLESSALGGCALTVMAVGPLLSRHFTWDAYFAAAWILVLLIWVGILAAAIQLNYMMSLIHRISVDQLTGAYSRQSGQELIDLYFHIASEQEAPFTLVFCDLDRFKEINDTYGHEAGDAALRDAVVQLHRLLRGNDLVIRWGGEEFVVLLTGTDISGARQVLQRLMYSWLGTRPDNAPLTASIGLAERITDGVADWPQLVELADQRMYQAKQGGRARAIICGGELLLPQQPLAG